MNKLIFISFILILASFSGDRIYKDGCYSAISRDGYTSEPYYGHVTINIDSGKITGVRFFVRDSAKHVEFDDCYERYFAGNDLYINQCRNDRKGIISYPDSLLKYQNIGRVDAMSGATWSYNVFRAAVTEALAAAGGQ